jgi:hypothetical protein
MVVVAAQFVSLSLHQEEGSKYFEMMSIHHPPQE